MYYLRFMIFIFLFLCSDSGVVRAQLVNPKPLTLLISIDGFKPDYLRRGITPNLLKLADQGTISKGLVPVTPTVTFPNHVSIVTGQYPDQHGIVNNVMNDPNIPNTRFRLSDRNVVTNPNWWSEVKPIWVSAIRQQKIVSTLFWPGTEVVIDGIQPNDWLNYKSIPSKERVDILLDWLNRHNETRADFATLYFSEVDSSGHISGTDSIMTNTSIENVDKEIGHLIDGLSQLNLLYVTHFVIVSDHGMANTNPEKIIAFSDLLPEVSPSKFIWTGAFGGIEAEPENSNTILELLSKNQNMQCWHKTKIPSEYHFGSHRRIPEIFCIANIGWTIVLKRSDEIIKGHHGYKSNEKDMWGLFIASGPTIKRTMIDPFENIDVYLLLCHLLNIKPEITSANDHLFKEIVNQ